jgi:hypothetical protein
MNDIKWLVDGAIVVGGVWLLAGLIRKLLTKKAA